MKTLGLYAVTAFMEILGCYAVFLWLRLGKPAWWIIPGAVALALFAWLLTLHPMPTAGRVYAAYGAVYIAASVFWMWAVEKQAPDSWDWLGTCICLIGAGIIYFAPRS